MDQLRCEPVPGPELVESLEPRPVFGKADLDWAKIAANAPDHTTDLVMRVGHMTDRAAIGAQLRSLQRGKLGNEVGTRPVSIRLVKGIPNPNLVAQCVDQFRNVIDEHRDRGRIYPATILIDPVWV